MDCCGVDHHRPEYTPQQRIDLDTVLAFNRDLVAALEGCRDLRGVQDLLDPDPLRYMWVDEGSGHIPEFLARARAALDAAPTPAGHRRAAGVPASASGSATRPGIAAAPDGRTLVTWLEWEVDRGERVVARLRGADGAGEPEVLTPGAADCFRPTALFDAAGTPWVLYGRSVDRRVTVFAQHRDGAGWSAPEQVGTTEHPSFNQEAVAHADGRVEVVWQGRRDAAFGAWSRTWHPASGWAEARLVSAPADGDDRVGNVWDPTVAALPGGASAYAWTEYAANSYRTVVSLPGPDGGARLVRPISSGTDYALHPSLAVTLDGSLWCAVDVVTVQGHGGSGPTRLRALADVAARLAPTGARPEGQYIPAELLPDVSVTLRVVRVTADGLFEADGVLADGLDVTPSGLPRLAADGAGGLTVAYRVHRRLPLMTYYWEVAAQTLGPDGWAAPVTFSGSDGSAEEVSVAGTPGGAVLCWQTDGRLERSLTWTEGFGGRECPNLIEHQGEIIWHAVHGPGEVRVGELTARGPARAVRPAAPIHSDHRLEARRWRQAPAGDTARHTTEVDGEVLALHWGDLHRHSLISRCTSGDEPSLEDFYRYAWDVCDYDFWAVTDHSENSSAYQWWCIQKTADLFDVPGRFAPFYGFEWTGTTGHQNVIFDSARRGAPIYSSYALGAQTPDELWARLRSHPEFPALTIPHHPGSAMVPFDWDYYDPEFLRIVEVFQACRGNYEDDGCYRQYADGTLPGTFVLDGLRRGHRFGLIASSDHGNGASFLGVYARSLDRAALFEGFRARRVFAATTRDVAVEARLETAEGVTFMGGETRTAGAVTLDVRARGYTDLAAIDLVRDGVVVHRVRPDPGLPPGWTAVPLRLEWGRGEATVDWSGELAVDGGRVLAAPFWSPEVTAVEERRVTWAASTRSFGAPYGAQRGGIELTVLAGPGAVVRITTRHGALAVDAAKLADVAVELPVTVPGRFTAGPGLGGLSTLGDREHHVRFTDGPVDRPTFYYARVHQVDGETAWSSPIWVDPA